MTKKLHKPKVAKSKLKIPSVPFALVPENYIREFDRLNCLRHCTYIINGKRVEL